MTTHTVEMRGFAFVPGKVTIEVGDSVQWTNRDAVRHSAKRTDDPKFATARLATGETSTAVVFGTSSDENGFEYFCDPHTDMVGVVVVKVR